MWYRTLLALILILLILIFQITFLGNLSGIFNLILVVLVLLISLTDFKKAAVFSLISGSIMDIYSNLPFGIFLISLFLVAIVLELFFVNFFTNRSFYSLILMGLIAVLFYHLFFILISGFLYLVGVSLFFVSQGYWLEFFGQLITTILILIFCFWIINIVSQRFKPIFLHS